MSNIKPLPENEIHAAVGDEGFAQLCRAFYARVPTDSILGPMYPAKDMDGAEERLKDFLIYRFGGAPKYIEQRGHPRLRARHIPFKINLAARDRWMEIMNAAIAEADLPEDVTLTLRAFFEHMATFMINTPD